MNLIRELRDASKVEQDNEKRLALKATADNLLATINNLYYDPDEGYLRDLNGLWAHGTRLLANVTPPGNDEDKKAVA